MSKLSEIMGARVEKLMDGERKKILLEAIHDEITAKQAISVNCLIGTGPVGKGSADGFDRIKEKIPIEFPKDHFTHRNVALEWYMGGGSLNCTELDSEGNKIGDPIHFSCVFTYFFRRIEPGDQKMILESHFSLVAENRTHIQSETSAVWNYENVLELPDPDTGKFVIKTKNLELVTLREDQQFFKHIHIHGEDTQKGIGINLDLQRLRPFLLHCGDGYQGDVSNGIAYGYYSAPGLHVTGTIQYESKTYEVTGGGFGMDHEWGTIGRPMTRKLRDVCDFLYALGKAKFRFLDTGFGLYGWESWFGLYFDDKSFITTVIASIKRIEKDEWRIPKLPNSQLLDPDGNQTTLTNLQLRIVEFAEIDGSQYPVKYEFTGTPKGDFYITVMTPDQRMRWAGGGYGYEGGVLITDKTGKKIGAGILENCGWDNKFTETVLSQLEIDKKHVDLFQSRSKKRGYLLLLLLISIPAVVLTAGIWGLIALLS